MEKEIQAIIQGLGYSEKGVYFPEPDCFESIRDLIRFLRYDTHSGLARRLCGEHNLVISDLIPIMKSANTSERLFDVALRLTINLCQPTINVFHGKMPEDREEWRFFTEMEKNLCRAKSAFADSDLMSILHTKISSYFTLEWTDRTESMKLIAERIFVLLGYVLSIGCAEYDGQSMFAEANSDDRVVMALLNSGIGEVIVNVAATPSEHDFHLSLLHIIALIVKQREVHNIITADREESVDEKTKEDEELRKCVEVESQKMLETRRRLGSRHTSFAGSYIIKGMKALNPENDLVLQKVVKKADRLEHLYGRKAKRRQPKNRRPFEGVEKIHSSALDVRLALKKFCDSVLLKCYNRLVTGCRDAALNGRRTLSHRNADVHYFLVVRFFMEYRRLRLFPSHLVAATLGKEGFHHVQTQLEQYLDMAYAERREGRVHGLRAQYALCAYKELLCTLRCMLVSGSNEEKEEAEEACKHIILMEEYRDLSSSIIRRFTPAIFSKTFLRILVLASHLYIGLLEKCAKSGNLLKVTKRQKVPKRRTKRRHNRASEESNDDGANQIDVDKVWGSICEELSDIVNGYEMPSEDVSPIDMRLQVDDCLYRQFASLMVQVALRERRVADAVGLYRTARALWPFEETFGSDKMQPEEEFIAMRVIYFSDLTQVEKECKAARESTQGGEVEDGEGNLFDAELEEDGRDWEEEEEEDEEATRYVTKEVDFSFDQYLMKFARTDVLKWYVFLLNEYETNSPELNKAILKLLHRIAFDLRQAPRLFQISLFRIFTRLAERFQNRPFSAIKADRFFRLYEFGFHLLKRFFASYEIIGSKLIPELLFWKGPKECHDLEYGYGSYDALTDEKKSKEMLWTEELDNEMRSLYDEYVAYDDKPEGIDVVEFIESNLSRERTRRQIIRQLKSLGLDTFGAKVKLTVATGGSKSTMFSASVLEQMKVFADQYRSLPPDQQLVDMIDYIRERLPEQCNRSRIIKQLKYEGIEYAPNTNARSHKAWSDMLVTELRSLAEQYEELSEKPSCGLIDYIRTRLTEKRTRRDIEAKLVEIGYDPGKLRTSRSLAAATSLRISTKVPKPWSELLLTELCSLKSQYEELEEDPQCDLADYVIARLSEKRWRRDVINKLAEIGADVSNMQKRRRKRRDKKLALSKANEETSGEERDRSASPLTSGRCRSVASSDELGLDDNLDDLLIASESGAEKNSYDRRSGRSENARSEQGDLISQDSVGIDSGAVEQANLATEAKALFGDSSNEDDEEIIVRRGKRMIEDTLSPPFGESIERSLEPSAPSSKKRIVLSDDEDE